MSLTFSHLTVPASQSAVEYVDGAATRVLEPGRHRRPRRAEYRLVSRRETLETTAPQEVLTQDGVAVRVTATVRSVVADPRAYLEVAADPHAVVYLAVQLGLREALVLVDAESVAHESRSSVGDSLTAAARAAGTTVGIDVRSVVVKDVMLPFDLREAYAAQVLARARGAAQLEAARAETAALRSLANGAKLLDEHPALARLRLVQALPPGSKVEIVSTP